MKTKSLLWMAAMALLGSCSNEEELFDNSNNQLVHATVEELPNSRVGFEYENKSGKFFWTESDAIGVYYTSGFQEYTLIKGEGTSEGDFKAKNDVIPGVSSTCAVYPYNANHSLDGNTLSFQMSDSYTYSKDDAEYGNVKGNPTNVPMMAKIATEGSKEYSFGHLGGALCFKFIGVPANADKFVFAANSKISGAFNVDVTAVDPTISTEATTVENEKTVTVNFTAKDEATTRVFYIPMPTGTYTGFSWKFLAGTESKKEYTTTTAVNTITDGKLLTIVYTLDATGTGNISTSVSNQDDLEKALVKGGNIALAAPITLSKPLSATADAIIDLNGQSITPATDYDTSNGNDVLLVAKYGATLTIKDSSTGGTGSIDAGASGKVYSAIKMTAKGDEAEEGQVAKLVVESGTLKGYFYAIGGNAVRPNTEIVINGGTLSSYDQEVGCGIFHPQAGEITISGGTVEAYLTAIEMRGGTLVVEDGTLTATCKDATTSKANGSGATIYGAAIGVSQHSTNNNLSVTIKGGTLTGSSALYEVDTCDDGNTSGISMSVTGGTLNGKVYSENCSSFITGGTFSDASAFNYLGENANVTLGAECELSSLVAINAANATIDLNENTVTANCQKAFEVYADATIKNGTIVSQQRCVDTREAVNLTLDNVVLEAPTYYSAYGNPQPLTIGGSEGGTKVTMDEVTINAGTSGYGIISFVKTELKATDCKVDGYVVLYSKADSDESEYVFTDCDLTNDITNNDVAGNSTTLINIEGAQGVKVNVNGGTVTSKGKNTAAVGFRAQATGNSVTIKDATITGNILYNYSEGNTLTVPAASKDVVTREGYGYTDNSDGTITITKAE